MKNRVFTILLFGVLLLITSSFNYESGSEQINKKANNNLELLSLSIPTISSITGYSDGVGVSNAKWTGNPHSNGCGNYSNQYLNFYVVDCYNYGSASSNPYYWDINGNNFGSVTGTVSITGLNVFIVSWTNTKIRVKPSASYTYEGTNDGVVTVNKPNNGGSKSHTLSKGIIPILKSRGYGQCTYEVAYRRIAAGKTVPPTAYSTSGIINSSYVPKQWDVLYWAFNNTGTLGHTGIITSTVTTSGTGNNKTYTFTLTERNADCGESVTSKSCTFKPSNNSGIYSKGSSTKQAVKYYR